MLRSTSVFAFFVCLVAAVGAAGPPVGAAEAVAPSIARAQAELEQLAARLPITVDSGGGLTPLTIDPYAEKDPAVVWNDWRMENKREGEPPLLVITAHNMWAYLHGVDVAEAKGLVCPAIVQAKAPWTSDSLFAAVINIAPGAPVLGEEAEVFISVDPGNPQHIVGSANHRLLGDATCTSALSTSGVTLNSNGGQELYWSTDGGATWSHQCAPWHSGTAYTLTSANGTSPFTFQSSDPSIAWDRNGNAYVFTLPWWQDASGSFSGNSTNVVKWDVGSNTWSAIATPQSLVNCTTANCDTIDKTETAIDTTSGQTFSHTNRMYISWTLIHFTGTSFQYTVRTGFADPPYTTWTIANFSPGGTLERGTNLTRLSSRMVVGADGTVYLAWDRNLTTGSSHRISHSTDGGTTWTTAVAMSSTATLTDFATNTKIAAQDTRGIALLPQIAVDNAAASAFKGNLYEAYTDFHTGVTSGNDVDVIVRRSTNGGTTWATVATFTGTVSGTSQFEPMITTDSSTGVVTVAWYDTSIDSSLNRKTQIYVSQSSDGGTTWAPQELVTDGGATFSHHVNFLDENSTDMPNVTTLHHYQYGEYMGAASSGGKLWLAWTDSRNWLTETPSDTEYEDIGMGYPCTPPSAPVLTSVTVPQNNRLDVAWNDSTTGSVVQYRVFRSNVPGGPYTQIAAVADSSPGVGGGAPYVYHDDTVSGGLTYYYVVTATDGTCPSSNSNEGSATATGICLLAPTFSGLSSVTNPGNSTCSLSLAWNAGTSNCGSSVVYNVYRSTVSGFAPAPANRIATGVAGTSTTDSTGIAFGTTYYYVVRAVDAGNAVEETNAVQKSGTPTGPISSSSATDTFEGSGGFDLAGWTHGTISGAQDWASSTAQAHDGTHSWFAADIAGPDDKVLVSPSFGVLAATTMSFWHTFAFEGTVTTCYDAGTLEYTTNGGATWSVVPAADFTSGGYTGSANTGFSNPIGGDPAWCAGTVGAMTQVTLNLGADANLLNKTVQIRWHEGDDDSVAATGWYVDTVAFNNIGTAASCTTGATCTPASCDDGNPCTDDVCDPQNGCIHTNNTASCNDGNACTTNDTCSNGTCVGGAAPDCNDNNPCTDDSCNPASGCVHTNNTAACNDGNACTLGDVCAGGSCQPGTGSPNCNDNNPCTDDACNPSSGCVHTNNTAPCDDGNACTVGDVCGGGSCQPGTGTPNCNDDNPCTDDACNPSSGCVHTNNTAPCDDGNACTTNDTCSNGACVGGAALNCDDNNPCTDDSCNPSSGCVHTNNTAPCDDGNACTTSDTCSNGACVGGATLDCNDNNPCTDDSCNPSSGCVHTNNTAPCDDGNACTTSDTCSNGACVGGAAPNCDDNNPCTDDSCNPSSGCVHANNTAPCNDGNACTQTDTCQSGACVGSNPVICAVSDQCHSAGTCDPGTGVCSNPARPNGTTCNDGNQCTQTDTCQGGACVGSNPVVCTASNQCHVAGTCNPSNGGCSNPAAPDGTTCNDGNACTIGDACSGGTCAGSAITAPPETASVAASSDKVTYSWLPATFATRYDVVRGSLAAFPVGPGAGDESCFDNLPGTSLTDATVPAVGSGFWYLSRGENSCGNGTWGNATSGPRATTTCP